MTSQARFASLSWGRSYPEIEADRKALRLGARTKITLSNFND
jgi:hypothetical protein